MMIGEFLIFLFRFAWLIWPVALLGDVALSQRCRPHTPCHQARWAFRAVHSLTLAAGVMVCGVEFFWLRVVHIHYHGGWETLVIGPLVLYVSVRLAQRLDAPPAQGDKAATHSSVAFVLTGISAALLLLACANSVTGTIFFLTRREPTVIFIVPLLTLIAVGSLARCRARRADAALAAALAVTGLLLTVAYFVSRDHLFLGFAPWGHAHGYYPRVGHARPYLVTGAVCFTVIWFACVLRRYGGRATT